MAIITGFSSSPQFVGNPTIAAGASITAGATVKQNYNVLGIKTTMVPVVQMPVNNAAGIYCLSAYCATDGVLSLVLLNSTGGDLVPAAQAVNVIAL
jgi:hypothetical protein